MARMVGLSRNIKLRWLNKTVEYIQEGRTDTEIKDCLHDYLSFEIKSKDNLRKSRDILLNIWVYSKREHMELQKIAVELITKYPEDALAIHWCMMLLTYPVLSDLSILLSNLSEYQDEIVTGQIKKKMYDEWGERTTLYHSLDKMIQTLQDMEILQRNKPGRYSVVKHEVIHKEVVNFMILITLIIKDGTYISVSDLNHIQQYFAFDYVIDRTSLFENESIAVGNFGGNQTISLR